MRYKYDEYATYYQNKCRWCNKDFYCGNVEKGEEVPCYTCESAFHDVCFKYHTAHTCFIWTLEKGKHEEIIRILYNMDQGYYEKPFDMIEVIS